MKITIVVEGRTEQAFKCRLLDFLKTKLAGRMPKLDMLPQDGRVPKGEKLRRLVEKLLKGKNAADHVIALTDVYTGTRPPDFVDAEDAKQKMRAWVGDEARFHPHAAQYDFEAWLLPYWATIRKLAGSNRNAPSGPPETINHGKPPAYHIKEIFQRCGKGYSKPRDGARILRDNDLTVAINQCPELKAFVNRILELSGGDPIA